MVKLKLGQMEELISAAKVKFLEDKKMPSYEGSMPRKKDAF